MVAVEASLPGLTQQRRRLLYRLGRVARAISCLDEWEAAQIMPPDVERPILCRPALESLRVTLLGLLVETDTMIETLTERRN